MRQKLFPPSLSLLALLALTAVAGHGQQQPAGPGLGSDRQVGRWVEPCLRLRSGASLDRSILECLEPGTRLRVLRQDSSWSQVRLLDGTEGWVDSGYLEAVPATPAPPPQQAAPASGPRPAPPPAARTPETSDLRGQIAALEGQLEAVSALRAATEERLRKTVTAAEQAQIEAGRLGQRVRDLERQRDEAGSERAAGLAAELAAGQARIAELEQALAAAEGQLLRAAELNAEQERRIEAFDASLASGRAGEAELRQALAAAEARSQAAEDSSRAQAGRIAELDAELPAARQREAELARTVAGLESRLGAAEETSAQQMRRIDDLTRRLAAAESRPAPAAVAAPPTPRPEPAAEPPPAPAVQVREPVVAAPRPPAVPVRKPLAMEPAAQTEPAAPGEAPLPPTEAAMDAVRAWAAAWSDQRVEDYLAFYAAGFRPADGLSRAAWQKQRTERLTRPRYIRVTISSLSAELAPDGTVRARFRQDYESDTFADTVTKVLALAEQNGVWRILAERAEP